jgi:hypothetical protein
MQEGEEGRKETYEPEARVEPAGNETGNEESHHLSYEEERHRPIGNKVVFLLAGAKEKEQIIEEKTKKGGQLRFCGKRKGAEGAPGCKG